MRKFLISALLALSLASCTRIGPGHVGIEVNMAGSDKGVSDFPAVTGWVTCPDDETCCQVSITVPVVRNQ